MEPKEKKQEIKIITRALLMEDYVPCQKFMTYFLNKLDYQVDLVIDSLNAIQNIRNKIYDLIIVDINIKGCLSGKKVIQIIRESKLNVGTPLIVWSAYVNEDKKDKDKYLAWGADTALIKACEFKDLEKVIWECLIKPRYERELHYKLKVLEKGWQEKNSAEWIKRINGLRHVPFSILDKALPIINEYQRWANASIEEKNPW